MSNELTSTITPKWKRTFFTLFGGQAFSIIGSNVVQFAITLHLALTTNSSILLTTAMLAGYLPQVIFGPLFGVWADRVNRKSIMILADMFVAAASAGLMIFFLISQPPFWFLFIILMLRSLGQGLHEPALLATIPLIVPRGQLTRVSGYRQAVDSAALLFAPVIAAAMLNFLPMAYIMLFDIGGAVIASAILLFFVPIPNSPRPEQPEIKKPVKLFTGMFTDMKAGIAELAKYRGLIMLALVVACAAFIFVPITTLFIILVTNNFKGGSVQIAAVQTAFGIGMLAGSLLLGLFGKLRKKVFYMAFCCILMGGMLVVVSLLPPEMYYLLVILAAMGGMLFPVLTSPFFAMVQTIINPNVLGRVMALIKSVTILATPLGLLIAGPVSELFGVTIWFLVAGSIMILLGGICLALPSIRGVDDLLIARQKSAKEPDYGHALELPGSFPAKKPN